MPDSTIDIDATQAAAPTDLAALMNAAVDAIVVIEQDGRIVAFSRAAEKMFGYTAAEMVGQDVKSLMPEPYRSRHDGYVQAYCDTGDPQVIGTGRKVQAIRKSGEVFPVWLSVGESRAASRRHFVGIVRDLSDQQKAEIERHSLELRLAHVSRLSLLGEMAAGIAHEINQPLTAISNYSEAAKNLLACDAPDPETLRKACTGIADQVQRAGEVIQNLRKFVRKREIEKKPLRLSEIIDGVMVLVNADATHEGVDVETRLTAGLPAVFGNAVQLQQVLLNLTRNAVDAMRGGAARPRELLIETVAAGPESVEIRVSDRGQGVSASLVDAIFHPFFTTKQDGLGVGLAISRSIIEAHGGRLSYEDRSGGGSTFIIRLPILKTSEQRN
jgi:two-component system sensor kinase FixL